MIIPFYNRIQWVADSIQSVMSQSYKNYEIILVDDGSAEDITSCVDIDKKKILYLRQKNKGPGAARNFGISMSNGEFVAFLDSDDIFLPNKLEKQIACMLDNPKVLMSHTSYQLVDQNKKLLEIVHSGRFSGYVYPALLFGCPIATPTVMIRREAFSNGLRFKETVRIAEDILFWSEIAQRSPILGIDQALTQVRKHGKNAAHDLCAQILGSLDFIEYGIRKSPHLGFILRKKLFSLKYFELSSLYLHKGKKGNCLYYAFLALCNDPLQFTRRIYVFLVRRIYKWAYPRKRIFKALQFVFHILKRH